MTEPPANFLELSYETITHQGTLKDRNEDRYLLQQWQDQSALLAVLADGMGGYKGGEIAAQIAIDTFKEILNQPLPKELITRYELLRDCFLTADQRIESEIVENLKAGNFQLKNMGATLVAAIITPTECLHLHAGDCRFYHFGSENSIYVTEDHSVIQLLLKAGKITPKEAKTHRMRGVVTSCLGGESKSSLSIAPNWHDHESPCLRRLSPGDVLLLSSDGLHGEISEIELQNIIQLYKDSLGEMLSTCVTTSKAKGSQDDMTAIAILVKEKRL